MIKKLFHGSNVAITAIDLSKSLVDKDFGLSVKEGLDAVYNSQLYDKILDLDTGLYYQSAGYNYQLLRKELVEGKLA